MVNKRDHIWSFPLIGGILTLIGLLTPASIIGSLSFNWMWGFSFFDLDPTGTFFYWSLLQFLYYLTPFIILLISSIGAIVLAFLIRKNGDFLRFKKLLYICGALFIIGSIIYFIEAVSLIFPFLQFYTPGFAMIAPLISGAIIIFGTIFNTHFLMRRSEKPDLIIRIKKFYRNILLSLCIGGLIFLIGSIISFSLIYLLFGDPVIAYLAAMGIHSPSPAQYLAAQHALGLDLPIVLQYIKFLCQTFTGNWGISISVASGAPVYELIMPRLPRTIDLMLISIIIVLGLGILLGRILAKNRGKWYDKLIQLLCAIGISIPIFVLGMFLQYTLAYLNPIFPATYYKNPSFMDPPFVTGFYIIDALLAGEFFKIPDYLYHLVLPIFCLSLASFSLITLKIRSYMVNKSREKSVISNTIITGSVFGFIFMFSILIETTFGLNGFVSLLIEAINLRDYWVISSSVFIMIIMFVIIILISNLAFTFYKFLKKKHSEPEFESKLEDDV